MREPREANRGSRPLPWRKLFLLFTTAVVVLYLICLPATLFIFFPFVGERNVTTAFLLYIPRSILLLPAPVALAFLWFFVSRRSALAALLMVALCAAPCMGWRLGGGSREPTPGADTLRIVSYNRGQHGNQSLKPFLELAQPDVVLLQESQRRSANYRRDEFYSRFPYIEDIGEFLILSRHEIVDRNLFVPSKSLPGRVRAKKRRQAAGITEPPVAARFVIQLPSGQKVSVYNVHTMTPRDTLRFYSRGGFVLGVLGLPGTPLAKKRRQQGDYWGARLERLEELRNAVEADSNPAIIAGDFNVPAGGYAYRKLRSVWDEAHHEVGSGLGYTFPGTTRNPLSLGGPWMRVDHIFFDSNWRALESLTESERPSQHRAVSAVLELNKS